MRLMLLWLLSGCFILGPKDTDTDADTDTDTDADTDTDTDADTDADADADTDADTDTDTDVPFEDYITSWGFRMIAVPAGSFTMGSDDGDDDESPVHTVELTRGFWLAQMELTQAQWGEWSEEEGSPDEDPSNFSGCDDCPVERVSWKYAAQYANVLSSLEGLSPCYDSRGSDLLAALSGDPYGCEGYRLPTEAEWEYAARAGESYTYAGSDDADEVAWTSDNSGYETHEVGELSSNGWGFYDLSGNVWEWTHDRYDSDYYAISPTSDPSGPSSGSYRVSRGGSGGSSPAGASVANRLGPSPDYHYYYRGFRLSRSSLDP